MNILMNQLSRNQSNLRAMPPRNLRFPVKWELTPTSGGYSLVIGRVIDISTTGLQMQISLPDLLGKVLQVKISPSRDVCIAITVKVVRLHQRTGGSFYYGTRILVQNRPTAEDGGAAVLHEILLKLRREQLAPDFARKLK
jgi:hypothetical protein